MRALQTERHGTARDGTEQDRMDLAEGEREREGECNVRVRVQRTLMYEVQYVLYSIVYTNVQ